MAKREFDKRLIQKYGKGTRRRLTTLGRKIQNGERSLVLGNETKHMFPVGTLIRMLNQDGTKVSKWISGERIRWVYLSDVRAIEGEGAYFEKGDIVYSKMTDRLCEVLKRFDDDLSYELADSEGQVVNAKNVELVLHETAGGHVVTPEYADYARPKSQINVTETPPERVYLAGPIATEGDVMFMSYLAEELRKIGYHVHAPHEDKSINDKTNDPSSDDIFTNDGDAINTSDIVVLVESGREQVGTHMEAGKIIERIESGTAADLELVVFTSNYRVENTQVEDGKASASVNHYALGGYKRAGVWVDGMSAGLIEYMRKRKELTQDDEIDENLYVGDIVRVGKDSLGGRMINEGSYAVVAEVDNSDDTVRLINREHLIGLDCWTNHGDVEKLSELELFTKEYAVKECLGDTLFKNSETLSPLKLVNGDVLVTVTKKGLKKNIFKGVYKLHRVDAKAVLESKYGYTNVFPFIGTLHNNYHVERNGKVCNILTGEEVNVRY